jgi:hypothetical protein
VNFPASSPWVTAVSLCVYTKQFQMTNSRLEVQWNVLNKVLIFQVVGSVSIDDNNNNVTYSTENIL